MLYHKTFLFRKHKIEIIEMIFFIATIFIAQLIIVWHIVFFIISADNKVNLLITKFDGYSVVLEDLMQIKGIGIVKATKIKCIAELSVRIARAKAKKGIVFRNSAKVADYYMETLRHRSTECVYLLCLDSKGQLIKELKLSDGSVKASLISPREIFLAALNCKAVNLILLHNHPSGDPSPSNSDIEITTQLKNMGEQLEIPLLDHIIIGDKRYTSFKESGII